MKNEAPWQFLLERIWPSRSGPPSSEGRRMALLQVLIALGIGVAAGPEIFLAMEMTTLLELLGASLFLTAFAAGGKLWAMKLCRALYNFALPEQQMIVMHSNAPAPFKAVALLFAVAHAAHWLALALVVGAFGHHVVQLVA